MKKRLFALVIAMCSVSLLLSGCAAESAFKNAQSKQVPESEFVRVGYFKVTLPNSISNRSFTVYTNCTDKKQMIKYARTLMYTEGGFTYVHFYNSKENTPDITTVNPDSAENAYNPEAGREYRILVYQHVPSGDEYTWDGNMESETKIDK